MCFKLLNTSSVLYLMCFNEQIHEFDCLFVIGTSAQPLLSGHPQGMNSGHLIEVKNKKEPLLGLWLLAAL